MLSFDQQMRCGTGTCEVEEVRAEQIGVGLLADAVFAADDTVLDMFAAGIAAVGTAADRADHNAELGRSHVRGTDAARPQAANLASDLVPAAGQCLRMTEMAEHDACD